MNSKFTIVFHRLLFIRQASTALLERTNRLKVIAVAFSLAVSFEDPSLTGSWWRMSCTHCSVCILIKVSPSTLLYRETRPPILNPQPGQWDADPNSHRVYEQFQSFLLPSMESQLQNYFGMSVFNPSSWRYFTLAKIIKKSPKIPNQTFLFHMKAPEVNPATKCPTCYIFAGHTPSCLHFTLCRSSLMHPSL